MNKDEIAGRYTRTYRMLIRRAECTRLELLSQNKKELQSQIIG